MGFFAKLFGKDGRQKPVPKIEHAVLVYLKLSNDSFGAEEERDSIHQLSHQLESVIDLHGVGEFDGDEFGGGRCVLYMYGPSADRLYDAVSPLLSSSHLSKNGYVIKRYGNADDPHATETRVNL